MSRVFTANLVHNLYNSSSAPRTTAPITIVAWIKGSSLPAAAGIIAGVHVANSVSDYFALVRHTDGRIYAQAKDSGGGSFAITASAATSNGVWHHVCGVFASSTSRSVYIDGTNKATDTTSSTPAGINATLVSGRYTAGSGDTNREYCFEGDIAEVAIWDIALSDAEVASLFVSAGVGVYPSDVQAAHLVGYWQLLGSASPEPATVSSLPLTVFGATGGTHLTMQSLGGGGGSVGPMVGRSASASFIRAAFGPDLPAPPTIYYDTTYTTPPGSTIAVSAADSTGLQNALNTASPGQVITLVAGSTYTGHFNLPEKVGSSEYIVIRSAAALTTEGVRITKAQAASFPKIVTNDVQSAITAADRSSYYRFINVEFTSSSAAITGALLSLGPDGSVTIPPANFTHHLIIDRCYVHGHASNGGRRGIMFSGSYQAVIDSDVSDWKEVGADTQAIGCWTGYGPYKIKNNYLEAAAENILFGGSGNGNVIGLTPADIEIRDNYFFKPLYWKFGHPSYLGVQWSIKNILELKHCKRVMIENNIFENCWAESQAGFAILLTVRNQTGSTPWAVVDDVTFRNNEIKNCDNAISLLGWDNDNISAGARRLLIYDNLITGIGTNPSIDGQFIGINRGYDDVKVDHNTVLHAGSTVVCSGGRYNQRFQFTNNICDHNLYGIIGDGQTSGTTTINQYFPGSTITKNLFEGDPSTLSGNYPVGNMFKTSVTTGVFVSYPTNLEVDPASSYNNAGTDGTDIGAILVPAAPTFQAVWAAGSNQLVMA